MTPEGRIIEALFRIPTKDGTDVNFELNSAQRAVDANLTGRDLVPKARQEGVSSYVLARFLAACLMYRNVRAVVISHDMESTQRLLKRVQYYIDTIRGPKSVVKNMSKNEITFPKMNSMFYIGTAGARKFGRGDTITHLHCSEYAYWPNPKDLMVGLLQAVPLQTGEIIVESTGNGFNDYHRRCVRAEEGKSLWNNIFLSWTNFEEYKLSLDQDEKGIMLKTLNPDWEEPELHAQGITLEQLLWRRAKLDELEYDLGAFKQEYPRTLDECFQQSSESIFHRVQYVPTDDWIRVDTHLRCLKEHPHPNYHYVMGNDVAAGVGKDSSTMEVFCLETNEQVAEYTNNRIDPEAFAPKIAAVGAHYNNAYAVVEQNNHGILTIATLRKLYPSRLLHRNVVGSAVGEEPMLFKLGLRTTAKNKPLMVGTLRTLLANEWTIHSPLLRSQLTTFIEKENGKLEAQDGCDDDLVMAAACAATGLNKAAFIARPPTPVVQAKIKDPFLLDNIIEEMHKGGVGQFPIKWQHSRWGDN